MEHPVAERALHFYDNARATYHELERGLRILHAEGWATGDAESNAECEEDIRKLMDRLRELF